MRRSEDKNKTVQKATLRCWKAVFSAGGKRPQMRNIAIFLGLQAHSEIVTVKTQLVLPTVFTCLMKESRLIRCLRDHVEPRSVAFLDPTLWVPGTLGHILLEWCWDLLCSATADQSCNRNYGIRKSWKLFLGQAIAYPTFGMEAQEAQVR